jgi:hypothetical protein
MVWTLQDAVEMCRAIEAVCPRYGCHVGLTGGTLYKDGSRKDADIIFYRIRQAPGIETGDLFAGLEEIGLKRLSGLGWCVKASWNGKPVDCFFPEEQGEYDPNHNTAIGDLFIDEVL